MDSKENIIRAIKDNNFESFKALINDVADINENSFNLIKNNDGDTNIKEIPLSGVSVLHAAAYYGSLQCFQYLHKEKQMTLRYLSTQNLLPLHYALYEGSTDISQYILSEDPEESTLHPETIQYFSILYCAIIAGTIDIFRELIKNGANLNDPWNDSELIIKLAISRRDPDLLSLLFSQYKPPKDDKKTILLSQ